MLPKLLLGCTFSPKKDRYDKCDQKQEKKDLGYPGCCSGYSGKAE
jgi:hypothetical protein